MTEEVLNLYAKLGGAGIITALSVWVFIIYVKNIQPRIKEIERKLDLVTETIRQNNNVIEKNLEIMTATKLALEDSQKVIQNNTEALLNFSKSLQYFTSSIGVLDAKIDMIRRPFDMENCNKENKNFS